MKKAIENNSYKGKPKWKCPYCKKNYQGKIQCEVHILNVHASRIREEAFNGY